MLRFEEIYKKMLRFEEIYIAWRFDFPKKTKKQTNKQTS